MGFRCMTLFGIGACAWDRSIVSMWCIVTQERAFWMLHGIARLRGTGNDSNTNDNE